MLEQQCWLWGQDVRYSGGNLLLAYGFDRARPPHDVIGASAYQLRLLPDETHPRHRAIALWGFGLWYGESDADGDIGGVFIGRADFDPRWSPRALPPQNAWGPQPLHDSARAPQSTAERHQTRVLLAGALGWIAEYETWALARLGVAERDRQLKTWQQARCVPVAPGELAQFWRGLAGRLQRNARAVQPVTSPVE